jgi:sugar O-acyltransferase (sialic acid O-acetyltransferase NeuD family)
MPFLSDAHITSVVIAGAGGFGLEVFDYLQNDAALGGPRVAGFIDDTAGLQIPDGIDKPLLGDIGSFRAAPGQVVVVAIGSVKGRKAVLSRLWANGVPTPAFIAAPAVLSPGAVVERGVVVCPYTIISRNARLGEGAMVNVHCSIGHGALVGDYSVLCPYSALNGDASIGKECFLGTRATIYPRIQLGDHCVVDTHAGVRASAGEKKMISSRGTYQVSALRVF